MTLTEARKILGLGPDEDPRPYLNEFRKARERIAEMVRTAPNESLGDRYQEGLVEFDQALAAIREYLEALGLQIPTPITISSDVVRSAHTSPKLSSNLDPTAEENEDDEYDEYDDPKPQSRLIARLAWSFVILIAIAGGGAIYYKHQESQRIQRQVRIALLERIGSEYLENRRWQDAAASFSEIEMLSPGSQTALFGRRSIEAGMTDEQTQFVGYWSGQAIAELEAGRLDEAEAAAKRVLEKLPGEKEITTILAKIAEARVGQSREAAIATARQFFANDEWQAAIDAANRVLAKYPADAEAKAITSDAMAAIKKSEMDRSKARDLLTQAIALDEGTFNQQALDLLREAATLSPRDQEIAAHLEKMASYTRTIRVPGDFDTPAEAIAGARDRDRIVLGEQVWKGPLIINAAIELQGAGSAKTIIECHADDGSAVTIGPLAKGARIQGITFRHESFQAVGTDRYSAVLVRGGGAVFLDCNFTDASGHGLAVIEEGEAIANRCRFRFNGWNGAAAIGKGSLIEVRDSEAVENFENGIETWDGATSTLVNNRCEANTRNGIHADNAGAVATIEGNQLIANREFGIVLQSAGAGMVSANIARGNLLGGMVIREAARKVIITGNECTLNQGPGIVLEKGLSMASYTANKSARNAGKEILADAELAHHEELSRLPDE